MRTSNNPRQGYPFAEPPPLSDGDVNSPEWRKWFQSLYDATTREGAWLPEVKIGGPAGIKKLWADKYMEQELISIDGGLFSDYSSGNGNIIYGFAANVRRSGGNAPTVGAQFNAYSGRGVSTYCWGIATEAWIEPGATGGAIGTEPAIISKDPNNTSAKWGVDSVFADRSGDNTPPSLGDNRFNYSAFGYVVSGRERSALGEFCGWAKGMWFNEHSLDAQNPRTWNATDVYRPGEVVTSGGQAWQCITANTNQLPALVSNYWVLHNAGGTACLAIGIDFSSLDLTTIGRMSSAIRLRDGMRIHWEVSGVIGTYFDVTLGRLVLVENAGIPWLAVDVINGDLYRNGVFLI